jgi:hypothetical protein
MKFYSYNIQITITPNDFVVKTPDHVFRHRMKKNALMKLHFFVL